MKIARISEWSNSCLTSARRFVWNKRALVPTVSLAIAAVSGILAVGKATGFFIVSARAQRIVRQATAWSKSDPNVVENQAARSKLIAEDLKENNLFWPSPKGHPVKAVLGIFGDEAYIDGKWYKVGAKVGDAEIIAIDATSVTTEWEGKKKVFRPVDAENSPVQGGSQFSPNGPVPRPGMSAEERAGKVVNRPKAPPMRGPEGARPDMESGPRLSDKDKAKMKEATERVGK
jgi:hypothetical protein